MTHFLEALCPKQTEDNIMHSFGNSKRNDSKRGHSLLDRRRIGGRHMKNLDRVDVGVVSLP